MKKTLLASAVLGFCMASSAQAATVVGFTIGGDYWRADTSGTFADKGQPQQTFDYSSSAQGSYWIAVEHPLPFVPNIKIRENSLDQKGGMSDADFNFNGHDFNGNVTTYTDLSNTDFVLYYEILDNDIVSLDLGAAYKLMNGSLRVQDPGHPEEKDVDSGIVMGYASTHVGMPGLGLYGFADLMQGVNESSVHDYAIGLGWQFDGLAVDTRVRVGYREFLFDVSNFSGVSADTKFKGYFAGVEINF
ncbi:MAG: TIGR04219 family outer membrane beta-barrel protein [Shewanella sp.]|uniref:TIGR04219 family outer membrane beta-barrel protein n=1 Tax=unclassified Shewanella TaxID=196818 RepID=UPI001567537E|nr:MULTISPECIES: TIGR04219 family outer membrane beta-barrel protein [unclassified Shewanella]MBW3516886.1 TIGR04219 family outer membrane beta-barrel protein [Shewanella sp. NKUCC01_JLK]MCU8034353.1 TIGR04219 family outer membrane beta-barrel protein [Shewanella sp. SM71]MCU8096060.1 TIGR04219 family outer membrane beta-barrel protein [Shewanella sp. SM102]NRD33342.1 TIGR04219 family outer membrane beta-barrel protein [Shewanella sp. DC2-4]